MIHYYIAFCATIIECAKQKQAQVIMSSEVFAAKVMMHILFLPVEFMMYSDTPFLTRDGRRKEGSPQRKTERVPSHWDDGYAQGCSD